MTSSKSEEDEEEAEIAFKSELVKCHKIVIRKEI